MSLFSFKQSAVRIAAVSIVVLLCSFLLMLPSVNTIASQFNGKELRKKANVGFQIPAPGKQQINDLEAQSFIEKAFPYYDLFSTVQLPSSRKLSNFYCMLIDSAGADQFPLTVPSLRVQGVNTSVDTPAVYADYAFQRKYNIKPGDQIMIDFGGRPVSMPVAAIIENSASYIHIQQDGGGLLIVAIPPALFSELQTQAGKIIQYSGAYLRVTNQSQAKAYLADYKPLGRLREQSTFKSASEYSAYLNDFNNTAYEAEIRDLSLVQQEVSGKTSVLANTLLILAITLFVIIVNAAISFSGRETQNTIETRIRNGAELQRITTAVQGPVLFTVIWSVLLLIALFAAFVSGQKIYCPAISYIALIVIDFGGLLVLGIIFSSAFAKSISKRFSDHKMNPPSKGEVSKGEAPKE